MKHTRIRKRPSQEPAKSNNGWRVVLALIATLAASNSVEGFYSASAPVEKRIPKPLFAQTPHRRRPTVPASKRYTLMKSKAPTDAERPVKRKRKRRRNTFSTMFDRLKAYYLDHGHCLVSSEDEDSELYKWTRSIRKNYKHQFTKQVRAKKQSPRQAAAGSKSPHKTRRPMLSESKAKMLKSVEFCWDVQEASWQQKYQQLAHFYDHYGHDPDMPVHAEDPALAVWFQNQRRDYRLWVQDLPSNLTPERLDALEELGVFEDYKTQREAWAQHYQYLVEFHQKYGITDVPQNYHHPVVINVIDSDQKIQQRQTTFALGRWCMNQRTARKRWDDLKAQETGKGKAKKSKGWKKRRKRGASDDANEIYNAERVRLLDALDFSWNFRDTRWNSLLQRLQAYYQKHGHLKIATADAANQDLRRWLIRQRHYYQRQQQPSQTSPMTQVRIASMEEAIPEFSWKAHNGEKGPSTEDWSNLFEAMRDKGIAPGARPKQHWFEGVNPFAMEVKSEWSEQELVDLWHQDGEDSEDDGFDDSMFANEEGEGFNEESFANGGGDGLNYFVDLEDTSTPQPAFMESQIKQSAPGAP